MKEMLCYMSRQWASVGRMLRFIALTLIFIFCNTVQCMSAFTTWTCDLNMLHLIYSIRHSMLCYSMFKEV